MILRSGISRAVLASSVCFLLAAAPAVPCLGESAVPEAAASSASSEAGESIASSSSSEAGESIASSVSSEGEAAASTDAAGSKENAAAQQHVRGIRNFSIIEGMIPDPMVGVTWDDTVGTVLCDTTKIDWSKLGTQELTYTIADMDQTIHYETIEVTIYENLEYYLYGMEGEKKIIVNSSFDPMEGISYGDKIASVTADTSALDLTKQGEYPVSYELKDQRGRSQIAVRRVRVAAEGADGWDNSDNPGNYSTVIDLGVWRLTAYMDTPEDQGPYVGQTASGAPLVPGRTVAVSAATCDRLNLHFGDKLLIDGHVYTLEDHGGYAMNNQDWADIFVDNPIDEFSERFNHYTEVYLLR